MEFRRNIQKKTGPESWTSRKHPPNTPKITEKHLRNTNNIMAVWGIFLVFSRNFLGVPEFRVGVYPKGPNLEKIQDLEFSSELDIFKRATHQTPIFCGEFWRSGLKISSEIEFSSEIEKFFKIWALRVSLRYFSWKFRVRPFRVSLAGGGVLHAVAENGPAKRPVKGFMTLGSRDTFWGPKKTLTFLAEIF